VSVLKVWQKILFEFCCEFNSLFSGERSLQIR